MNKSAATRLSLLLLVAAIEICNSKKVDYSGYTLFRCLPQTEKQIEQLHLLVEKKGGDEVEFWREPSGLNMSVDIMASSKYENHLRDKLDGFKIPTKKIMHNVGKVIEKTSHVPSRNRVHSHSDAGFMDPKLFYSNYQPYSVIEAKLNELDKDPRVTVEIAGYSYEKRKIYLVKVSTSSSANKPVIFIDAGHHAREWVSHSTGLYILESLINENMPTINGQHNQQHRLSSLLNKYDIWFVPVVNPDGYVYTHTTDRLWRKTRSSNVMCSGVDPNRNYNFHWAEAGASSFSCSQTYAGPKALSEPETRTITHILDSNKGRIIMYITLHAYSQLILTPYGHKQMYPDNYEELKRVATAGTKAIASLRGTNYQIGPSAIMLYPAAGGSDDYAHGGANVRFAYTIELPDSGEHGFLLPPKDIIPVGQETAAGLAAMIGAI